MKIKIVQPDIVWENVEANIQQIDKLLSGWEGDLIVLPEMWSTGFSMEAPRVAESMDGPAARAMKTWSSQTGALVMGSLAISESSAYFNRCIMAFPDNTFRTYDKRHLFTYAGEEKHYVAGQDQVTIQWKDWTIMPQVCYDLRFPEAVRYSEQRPYQLLVYMANWPARRSFAWRQLLIARAIENQCYVIGANRIGLDGNGLYYDGGSRLIDFSGKTLVSASDHELCLEAVLNINDCSDFREKFPFLRDRKQK